MPQSKPEVKEEPKLTGEKGRNVMFTPNFGPADGTVMESLLNYINAHGEIDEPEYMSKDPAKAVEDKMIFEETIKKGLASLSPKEAEIVSLRYGLNGETPMTLLEIGKKMNLSKEMIRHYEERALLKFRRVAVRKLGFDEFAHHPSEHDLQPGWLTPKPKTDILGDAIPTKPYRPKPKTDK